MSDDTKQLAADDTTQLQTGDDLALDALSQTSQETPQLSDGDDDEVAASNELAATLNSLQSVIERNAELLEGIQGEIKEKRESLKNVFDNDSQLTEASEEAKTATTKVKERRASLQSDPQVTALKVQVGELNQQKKELEETLSNHLVNYYSLTNSKSFDTSDGDQWEFSVRAKVKKRKKS